MIIRPRLNLFQRAANRVLYPFGMRPFPFVFESELPEAGGDPGKVFDAVYAQNYWTSPESKSGPGSELATTVEYRAELVRTIRDLGIQSMFDAPCGDLNWMPRVIDQTGISYIGGDVAQEAVESARRHRPDLQIEHFDICTDRFPDVDLWHCRDTFFHLSFADIARAMRQAKEAQIKYAAITTHKARMLRNLDIKTGGSRLLDLERPPFSFGKPLRYLQDYRRGEFPRFVAIWRLRDIPTI